MTNQPLFHAPPPQNVEGVVLWVPEPGEPAVVEYRGQSMYASLPPGVTIAEQDVVSLQWVGPATGGRTLRISQVIAHAPTANTTEGA